MTETEIREGLALGQLTAIDKKHLERLLTERQDYMDTASDVPGLKLKVEALQTALIKLEVASREMFNEEPMQARYRQALQGVGTGVRWGALALEFNTALAAAVEALHAK